MLRAAIAALGGLARDLSDLVLPQRCVGCGQPAEVLCRGCITLAAALDLRHPEPSPSGFPPCAAYGDYGGVLQSAIIAVKEHHRRELVVPLGDLLADAVQAIAPSSSVVLVPVPSSRGAARERGGDHMLRIGRSCAAHLADRTGDRWQLSVALQTTRFAVDATAMNRSERLAARSGSFIGRRGSGAALRGRDVVIVDDVLTTGATLSAVAAVLRGLGARTVRAATIAATRRNDDC